MTARYPDSALDNKMLVRLAFWLRTAYMLHYGEGRIASLVVITSSNVRDEDSQRMSRSCADVVVRKSHSELE